MKKPEALRAWLAACLPQLAAHPDQLQIWVDEGQIEAQRSHSLSFQYRYQLSILATDWTGSPDALVLPLLAWIEREQPDLLQKADGQPFTFEAEILDSERVDLLVKMDLTERVVATPREDGTGFDVTRADPPPVDSFFTDGSRPLFRQGFAAIRQVAPHGDEDAVAPPESPAP